MPLNKVGVDRERVIDIFMYLFWNMVGIRNAQ
jgi:hypothetical protein